MITYFWWRVHSEAPRSLCTYDIASMIVCYNSRIVYAILRYHELAISFIDYFFSLKIVGPRNENAGK